MHQSSIRQLVCAAGTVIAGIAAAQSGLPFLDGRDVVAIEAELRELAPDEFREIGNTSIAFRANANGTSGAFRPATRSSPRGYLADIAAYEIARKLHIDSVPPSVFRAFDEGYLRARLGSRSRWNELDEELADGSIAGSFTHWVDGLSSDEELDRERGLAAWQSWLRVDGPSLSSEALTSRRALARDISTCLVFDYLIGNGDRLSGGNMRTVQTAAGPRFVIRDHNLAFAGEMQGQRLRHIVDGLTRVGRVSRGVVAALRTLTSTEMSTWRAGSERVLLPREIVGVLERRDEILSYFAASARVHGEANVYYFE